MENALTFKSASFVNKLINLASHTMLVCYMCKITKLYFPIFFVSTSFVEKQLECDTCKTWCICFT